MYEAVYECGLCGEKFAYADADGRTKAFMDGFPAECIASRGEMPLPPRVPHFCGNGAGGMVGIGRLAGFRKARA